MHSVNLKKELLSMDTPVEIHPKNVSIKEVDRETPSFTAPNDEIDFDALD